MDIHLEDRHYCTKCTKKVDYDEYCDWACTKHYDEMKLAKDNGLVIKKYAESFWNEIGIRVDFNKYEADLYGLKMDIKFTPNFKNDESLESITYNISGMRNKIFTITASIFNHTDAVEKVKAAIAVTLRSKVGAFKSAKTAAINKQKALADDYDKEIAGAQALIKKWNKAHESTNIQEPRPVGQQ